MAGLEAEAFSDTFGLKQCVSFPTRGSNALDLVFSDVPTNITRRRESDLVL